AICRSALTFLRPNQKMLECLKNMYIFYKVNRQTIAQIDLEVLHDNHVSDEFHATRATSA
ncbi:MAG TPA: hypothetical protein VLG38_01910, partial [Gammaproteobacteria bacterium]|nr:hypothetical protein [Gammaproteobacteria bacterium]